MNSNTYKYYNSDGTINEARRPQMLEVCVEIITCRINKKIQQGITFEGARFALCDSNKVDLLALAMFKDAPGMFPLALMDADGGFYTFTTAEHYMAFLAQALPFCLQARSTGWQMEAALVAMTCAELINFIEEA